MTAQTQSKPKSNKRRIGESITDARPVLPLFNVTNPTPESVKAYNATANHLRICLERYDQQVIQDNDQLRTYITNRLLEISQCGSTKEELKALELLGKSSDVSLFSEKTEINITHTTSATLEDTIKNKLQRLLAERTAAQHEKNQAAKDAEDAEFWDAPEEIDPGDIIDADHYADEEDEP